MPSQLPASPDMLDGSVITPGPPTCQFIVGFDIPMDTGVTPTPANFTCLADGIPVSITNPTWLGATTLRWDYPGSAPSSSGLLTLDAVDANLRSADLVVTPLPQDASFFP